MLTLVTGVLVARSLQAEGRGIFAAVQIWPGIISAVGLLGVNYSLALRAAKAGGNLLPLARIGVSMGLGISAIIVVGLWFIGPILLPPSVPNGAFLTRVYLFALPASMVTAYLQAVDQGAGLLKGYNATRIAFNVVYLVAVSVCWVVGLREVFWFLMALLVAQFVTSGLRVYLTGWRCLIPNFAFNQYRAVTKEGGPFLLTTGVQISKDNLERLLLLYFLGTLDLGIYVIAATSAGLHATLGKSINMIVLPRSSSLSPHWAAHDTARIFRVMALVNLVLSLAVMSSLPFLIPLFFGPAFEKAVLPSIILVFSQYFGGQGSIIDEGLRGQAKPFVGMLASVIAMGVFAALAWVLTKHWGLIGVAVAAVGCQLAYCAILYVYVRRRFKPKLLPSREDWQFIIRSLGDFRRGLARLGRVT